MNGKQKIQDLIFKGANLYLDSMIFIYALEDSPRYHDVAYSLLKLIEGGVYKGKTSVISTLETLSSKKLKGDFERIGYFGAYFANVGTNNIEVINVNHEIAFTAAELRRNYNIVVPDAVQMATAVVHKCDLFITNDEVFRRVQPIMTLILDDLL